MKNVIDQAQGDGWALYNADCVKFAQSLPDNCVDISVYSPPFSSLYVYSESVADMGNVASDAEFMEQYRYLVREKYRVLRPGRLTAIHVKDLVYYQNSSEDGSSGLRPFSDQCTQLHLEEGFTFHCRITIFRDPVLERAKTNAHGLLWKTFQKDASFCRVGMPEYLLVFRKWAKEGEEGLVRPVDHPKSRVPLEAWQELASPVWNYQPKQSGRGDFDMPATDVLNVKMAADPDAEKHLCLARGSLVLTRDGYIPIEEVAAGDEVLTHQGRWRRVLVARMTGERSEVVDFRAQGVAGLRLTPDHKLWVRQSDWVNKREGAARADPEWVRADESVGGFVNVKLPPVEDSFLTECECWLVGRWLADGHVGARGDFCVSVGPAKLAEFERMAGAHAGTRSEGTATQIRLKGLSDAVVAVLARCGRRAAGKRVPAELLSLDSQRAASVLSGYLSGDGYYIATRNRWQASSASRALLLGIAMLAQRVHGTVASLAPGRPAGEAVIQGRQVTTQQEWVMSFDSGAEGRRTQPFVLEDGAWKRVRSADPAGVSEVWCLRVEEDESFTAEGCIVKNCPMPLNVTKKALALWSNEGDTVFSPFAGIGSEGVSALSMGRRFIGTELHPTYYRQGAKNLADAERSGVQTSLFDLLDIEAA